MRANRTLGRTLCITLFNVDYSQSQLGKTEVSTNFLNRLITLTDRFR